MIPLYRKVWRDELRALLTAGLGLAILASTLAVALKLRQCDGTARPRPTFASGDDLGLLPGRRQNLILISTDTLRADVLGSGGYSRSTSPVLDRLARDSVIFSDCITSAPHTVPSHATIFTGLFQRLHGLYDHHRSLPREFDTMAEILASHGYRTAAITNSPKFHASIGLDQGFEHYQVVRPYETEPWLEAVLAFLETPPERPLFLFFHLLDPHAPYRPPPLLKTVFHPPFFGAFNGKLTRLKHRTGGATSRAYRFIDVARAWYDSEVLEVDMALGRIFARIEDLGLFEDSVVVVLSDHGEEFLDHGGMEHSHSLFDELLRVPLLIRAPGWPRGRLVTSQVRTVDILPTVLELLGLPTPMAGSGVSLSPWLQRETGPAFSELGWNAKITRRSRGKKLLYDLHYHRVLGYFDLLHDPAEKHSGVKLAYAEVEKLVNEIENWAALISTPTADESDLGAETLDAIRALGYIGD